MIVLANPKEDVGPEDYERRVVESYAPTASALPSVVLYLPPHVRHALFPAGHERDPEEPHLEILYRRICLEPDRGYANGRHTVASNITREELKAKMDRGDDFVLVEALSRAHYESSHLPGAINLPYEFVDEAEEVLPDKDKQIVVYCMNPGCSASAEEARELEEMGYTQVLHYAAGKQDWIRAGLPVEGKYQPERVRK
jgi:rhodanese-related sulfurtransferase